MNNINKTAADRVRDADDVVTAIEVQGPAVADAIEPMIFEGAHARKVSVAEMLTLIGQVLGRSSGAYREADAAHTSETSSDGAARSARDEAAATLHDRLLRTESLVRGAFGAQASTSMGLEVAWASRPDLLLGQARNAAALVKGAEPGKPVAPGVKVDLEAVATDIEDACEVLETSLTNVVREERAAQGTFQKRQKAAADWEQHYHAVSEIFTGLCMLAGHDELAARVKPVARKNGKHDVTVEAPTTTAPAAPTPTTPAAS